jgi:hypothetical protein
MTETTPQQKANLARIRDNQRRSRARRKDYLAELETKYRSCEAIGAEASSEIQAAARRVLEENKRLRRLLRAQGLSDADIDGSDHDEYASTPSAADMLNVMLVTPKPCRPSACDDGQKCKTEHDQDDMDMRRQSCVSAPTTSWSIAPSPRQHNRPIALAPALAPVAAQVHRPQSHDPLRQQQQQQPHGQMQLHVPLQHQQPMQFQAQPLQPQHQQHFMTLPAPPISHHDPQFPPDYSSYAPQSFDYGMQLPQVLDWDMASVDGVPPHGAFTASSAYASPSPGYPPAVASYESPTTSYNGQDNTSSCFAAAGAIRVLHADAGNEVESALGCREGAGDCRVNNSTVFDLMDRYGSESVQGQQGGI